MKSGDLLHNELLNLLMQHPSQQHIKNIAARIGSDEQLIATTITLGRKHHGRAANHASWVMRKLFDEDLHLLLHFREELFEWVLETEADSVRRNLLPLLTAYLSNTFVAQSELVGQVYFKCLEWADSERYAISVRCNAMEYLAKTASIEPALKQELLPLFEMIHQHAEGGVWVRSRQILEGFRNSEQAHRRKKQAGKCSPKENREDGKKENLK
ncbi:MAG: hypothetical protein PHG67_13670 [Bacteroidales bacterium]|jgi:hypothetical protein|nr:hypothetical protein [Bacteroidales bacterium]